MKSMSVSESFSMHPLLAERTAGVLLHPTSLPATHGAVGIGDLGPTARQFAEWVAEAGLQRWQVLPIGPVGDGDSPYSARSSFAIEPMLVSVADLAEDGYLPDTAVRCGSVEEKADGRGRASWRRARKWKTPRLEAAFQKFCTRRGKLGKRGRDYLDFVSRQAAWLQAWCQYAADQAQRVHAGTESQCDPKYHAFLQFILDRQWCRLRRFAHARGVHLIGDIPIFCAPDSADVESRPELFRLDRAGRPTMLTGVPPPAEPDEEMAKVWGPTAIDHGQLWGHPHYKWSAHREEGWAWWQHRVCVTLERFDLTRIDHFVGFHNAYEIPCNATDLRVGRWRRTPGIELLASLADAIGPLPFIAEDLGDRVEPINRLRDQFGLVGMRSLQMAFFGTSSSDSELPHNHPRECVVYPGGHDNDTVVGWYRSINAETRRRFVEYAGPDAATDPAGAMMRLAFTSPAGTAIVQMQDLLRLGKRARMNHPGDLKGNWCWRMRRDDTTSTLAKRIRALAASTERLA